MGTKKNRKGRPTAFGSVLFDRRPAWIVAFALLLASTVGAPAYAAGELDELARLVESGQAHEAYALASRHLPAYEGDPRFDFYYGVAAVDSGHVSEGAFALERVVLAYPENDRARLELARAYFLLREDQRAREEFDTVLRGDPPPSVRANIERFLEAMRRRQGRYQTAWSAYLEAAVGHDTNVNSATDDPTVFSPLFNLNFRLADSGMEESDDFLNLAGGFRVDHPVAPGRTLHFGADVSRHDLFHDDEFDTTLWQGFGGMGFQRGDDAYKVKLIVQDFELDDSSLRRLKGITGEWNRSLNQRTRLEAFVQAADLDYPDQEIRDSAVYIGALGAQRALGGPWNPTIFGSVFLGYEDSSDDSDAARAIAERNFGGVRLGVQAKVSPKVRLTGALTLQNSHYDAENAFFGATRDDDFYYVTLGARWLVTQHWSVLADVSYARNDSTLSINDYDRTQAQVGVRYDFF